MKWNIWLVERDDLENANELMLPEHTTLEDAFDVYDSLHEEYPSLEFLIVPIH